MRVLTPNELALYRHQLEECLKIARGEFSQEAVGDESYALVPDSSLAHEKADEVLLRILRTMELDELVHLYTSIPDRQFGEFLHIEESEYEL